MFNFFGQGTNPFGNINSCCDHTSSQNPMMKMFEQMINMNPLLAMMKTNPMMNHMHHCCSLHQNHCNDWARFIHKCCDHNYNSCHDQTNSCNNSSQFGLDHMIKHMECMNTNCAENFSKFYCNAIKMNEQMIENLKLVNENLKTIHEQIEKKKESQCSSDTKKDKAGKETKTS
jgi:hypothetical protein